MCFMYVLSYCLQIKLMSFRIFTSPSIPSSNSKYKWKSANGFTFTISFNMVFTPTDQSYLAESGFVPISNSLSILFLELSLEGYFTMKSRNIHYLLSLEVA